MSDTILFVTSYSKDLYESSAKYLLQSFRLVSQPGILLCTCEGLTPDPNYGKPNYEHYDLGKDEFLQTWLKANRDVIPKELGGTTEMCKCPDANIRHGRSHARGCYWHWMNRNASRWFRKVVALRAGVKRARELGTPWLMWLDADCNFIQPFPLSYLQEKTAGVGLFHFRGHREATESGIVGFNLPQGGQKLIDALCRRYESRDYLKYHRWDDGFHFSKLIDEGVCKARDLVHPTKHKTGPHKTEDVIPTTDMRQYISHLKGRNGAYLNIMK